MAPALLPRSLRPSASFSADSHSFICQICRRDQSTYARTRKALRVKPDPSFLPSKTELQDHIIVNPPSSLASVYHTPSKFLPKSDPRRRLHSLASPAPAVLAPTNTSTAPTGALSTIAALRRRPAALTAKSLPSVRPEQEKRYHLAQPQIDEIRRLRVEDPRKWTRMALAEKFECSQFFISLCCSAPERKDDAATQLAEIKSRWGRRKTEARLQRSERKKMWGRDA